MTFVDIYWSSQTISITNFFLPPSMSNSPLGDWTAEYSSENIINTVHISRECGQSVDTPKLVRASRRIGMPIVVVVGKWNEKLTHSISFQVNELNFEELYDKSFPHGIAIVSLSVTKMWIISNCNVNVNRNETKHKIKMKQSADSKLLSWILYFNGAVPREYLVMSNLGIEFHCRKASDWEWHISFTCLPFPRNENTRPRSWMKR